MVWGLTPGGPDQPGTLWAGCMPAGLFQSDDGGQSWALNTALWEDPRRMGWFGGGNDFPGMHSVLVDPRNAQHITVAVSCGGVWQSQDGGTRWTLTATGMSADYMPTPKTRTAWCNALCSLMCCGCSTTAGFTDRPTADNGGTAFLRPSHQALDSRCPAIRKTHSAHGLCLHWPIPTAMRRTEKWWSTARMMVEPPSRLLTAAYRTPMPTTWSTATV